MRFFSKAVDRCVSVLAGVAAIILFVLLLAVCFATFSRYLFNKPFASLIDLSSYALVWVAFLAAPWLMGNRGHVHIDLFMSRTSAKAQRYWMVVVDFAMVVIALVIAYVGMLLTVDYFLNDRVMQDWMQTPQWILLLPIPLGAFFLALRSLLNGLEDLKQARSVSSQVPPEELSESSPE